VNLIAPMNINDNDFDKFHTDLGLAMKVLKYQNEGVVEVIQSTNHKKIDRDTAVFLNAVTNLPHSRCNSVVWEIFYIILNKNSQKTYILSPILMLTTQ
jgi:hypothetical protein